GGRRTNPDPPAELGVPDGLEGRHLHMSGLDELRIIVRLVPGRQQPVDAVAGVAEDVLDTPLPQPLQQVVANVEIARACHQSSSPWFRRLGNAWASSCARWTASRPPLSSSWIWVRQEKPSASTAVSGSAD